MGMSRQLTGSRSRLDPWLRLSLSTSKSRAERVRYLVFPDDGTPTPQLDSLVAATDDISLMPTNLAVRAEPPNENNRPRQTGTCASNHYQSNL